jgi:large subunit ribosomal protein L17
MHRHGFKGRKFGRERDQRRALMKGLASNLVINGSIETTEAKAKEIVPYLEKLITTAKKGDLAARRRVISKLANVQSAHKLVDEIAPKLSGRTSGHLRIKPTAVRRGDNAQMYKVTFVDDLKAKAEPVKTEVKKESADTKVKAAKTAKPKASDKPKAKPAVKKEVK